MTQSVSMQPTSPALGLDTDDLIGKRLRSGLAILIAGNLLFTLADLKFQPTHLSSLFAIQAIEVLAMLEGMSGELAAKRITDEQLAEVRAMHYEMMACFTRRDLSGYYRLNARIHTAINEAAGNPVLANTYRSINARVQSLRFRTNQDEAKWKHAVEEHEQMIQALAARDAPAMRKVLVAHLIRKRDTVLALLRAGEIYPQPHKAS